MEIMDDIDGMASTSASNLNRKQETTAESSSFREGDQDEKNAFCVDTNLIPRASLDEQNSELNALGLSVFNQDVFEEGVMNQVDQALAKEEKIRLHKILVKELSTINDDVKMAENDLARVEAALTNIEDLESTNRETQRELESIRRQQANKIKQLKTLSVRRENVLKKIKEFEKGVFHQEKDTGSSTFDQAFQVQSGAKKETDEQRMVRMGEMTPFGTIIKKQRQANPVRLSVFEKSMSAREAPGIKAKKDFKKYLKRKSLQSKLPHRKEESSHSVEVKTDESYKAEKDIENNRRQNRQHSNTSHHIQDDFSDDEESNRFKDDELYTIDDEDEYVPSKDEMQEESSDEDQMDFSDNSEEDGIMRIGSKRKIKSKSSFKRKRPRPLPIYREKDEEEPTRTRVKRDLSIRREKDDADPEDYQTRLYKFQKLEAKREKNKWKKDGDNKEDDDNAAEFEGGFHVPLELWRNLFHYQKTGVRWLWELHLQQAGGIVGDEMGLGKTIQTISFLAALRTSKVRNTNFPYKGLGPSIIICPTSIMHQWVKEFHKWWPEFRVAILHSSGSFTGSESEMVRSIAKSHGVLITSYNTLVIHQELILRFNWHYVILDEGHKIRNPDAKVTLCCKQFRTPHRIILSGSPIQNNLKELWSLFDFVFPGKLGTLPDFMQHFSVPIVQGGYSNATQIQVETAYRCACVLRDTINPYLIRRMKADVKSNINLPDKNEQVLFCRITDEQRDVYEEYLSSRECNAILQGKFKVFAGLITLRKICNHPDLSTGGPKLFKGEPLDDDPGLAFGYWRRSGKMIVLEALLSLWKKQNHRVLLFTQSKSMLDILAKFVQDQGYSYVTMDGGTTIGSRQPLIAQYNSDPSIYLFLLTTRVGGLGVNLTGADRVIIFDPDWNPSTDMQARERAWRIGQTKQVTIYRLLTSGTIEEKIYHRQIFKQFLTNRILKDPKQRRLFQSQQLYDLFTLGSKDNKEGTETSALFAGTGCNVKVPPKQKRLNRFDELNKRKEEERSREKDVQDSVDVWEREEEEDYKDSADIKRMKEFARKLSRKMEEEKKEKRQKDVMSTEDMAGSSKMNDEEMIARTDYDSCLGMSNLMDKASASRSTIEAIGSSIDIIKDHANLSGEENVKVKCKKWKIPQVKSSKTPEGDIKPKEMDSHERNVDEKDRKSSDEDKNGDKVNRRLHKKKRKYRDARFEGEKIPHLVGHNTATVTPQDEDQDQSQRQHEEHSQEDNYVLRQLFKKTGIEGAMKHDMIVDSSRPDYAIVEAEASRVAKEAAIALKRSRRQCLSALSGAPTWTGQNGGLASKPRFGQKKNTILLTKADKTSEPAPAASSITPSTNNDGDEKSPVTTEKVGDKEKLFDGSISGNSSLNSKNNSLTSNDLLFRIRSRKQISSTSIVEADEDDEFLRPDVHQTLNPKDEELLGDIRNYVAFMASTDGEASTQEIVLNFGKRLPKSDAPKFKAMLKQICDLNRGIWRLKPEFR